MYKTTANAMTAQQLCDYSVKAIVKQGFQCVDSDGNCVYSDDKGNHCGIGQITNPKHHEAWDEITLDDIIRLKVGVPKAILKNEDLFDELQSFHDCTVIYGFERILKKLNNQGIKTHRAHWKKWVDLRTKQINKAEA